MVYGIAKFQIKFFFFFFFFLPKKNNCWNIDISSCQFSPDSFLFLL
jgi:hypothetical protein